MLKRQGQLVLLAALSMGCTGQNGAGDRTGAVDGSLRGDGTTATAASDNSGLQVSPNRVVCGGAACEANAGCCTADGGCGVLGAESIFLATCVSALPRGGSVASGCPGSPQFCLPYSYCQSFVGCRTSNGDCGFWVDKYLVGSASGELATQITANLGCVPKAEFVSLQ